MPVNSASSVATTTENTIVRMLSVGAKNAAGR
jgi:hypothetical protein